MAKVNICVCVKNRQRFLETVFHSLVTQTYEDLKILGCDGISQDDTMSELFYIQQGTHEKVIAWHTEEEGYVNTHNFILSKIDDDCEYVGFVESDDLVDENKVKYQVEYLEAHPEVDVVSSCVVFSDKKILINTYMELNDDQITEGLKKGIPMSTICHFPSCIFRRKVLEKFINGKYFYDEYDNGMCGEGFLYTLHFLGYKFANIPTTIYLYRRGLDPNSMSNTMVPEFANLINMQEYDMKKTAIMELFDKYNGKPIKKKTSKKKIEKKEEDENPKVEVLDEVKVEEPVVEEASKKKRGRPKKTQE